MNQQKMKTPSNLRPLGLTAALCLMSIASAIDMEYGTALIGYLLFAAMIAVLCVIFMTCERYIFVLDAVAMLVILFFASSGSLQTALLGAVLIISAMILSVFIRKKCAKTVAVLTITISAWIGFIAVFAIFYAAEGGSLLPNDLLNRLNEVFDGFKLTGTSLMREYIESMPEELFEYYQQHDVTKDMLIAVNIEAVETYIDYLQMLIPGFFVFAIQIWGYLSTRAFEKTVRLSRYDALLPQVRWDLYPTQFTCVAYLIVATVYLFTSFFSSASVFAILVTNIWIALMPVMLACGFRSLWLRLKHPRFRFSTVIIIIVFAIGFFFMPDTALTFAIFMLAFMGAQDISLARTAESARQSDGKNDHL